MNDLPEMDQPTAGFDIAIVGMAGRFPGARNLDEFWQNLVKGVESITRFSDKDLLESGVPASSVNDPNYVKAAPILEDAGHFDAGFFGFSPMEAKTMDPQHRILLELAYEALEDANCDRDRYPDYGRDRDRNNGRYGRYDERYLRDSIHRLDRLAKERASGVAPQLGHRDRCETARRRCTIPESIWRAR